MVQSLHNPRGRCGKTNRKAALSRCCGVREDHGTANIGADFRPNLWSIFMSVTMREMLEAGVHFGHQTRFWNSMMAFYIFVHRY